MARVSIGNIEVDRCTGCQGIWFDSLEDDRLRAAGGAAAADIGDAAVGRQHDAQQRIQCPRCHTRMIAMVDVEQPEIRFESCKFCYGRFLDAGELRTLADDGSTLLARWQAAGPPPMA
jgi:Zn-finger nucleic acid-binding protein